MMSSLCISLLLVVLASSVPGYYGLPETCSIKWEIDWNRQIPDFYSATPFKQPGVIVSGKPNITFNEVAEFVGRLWNGRSWQEISGLTCVQYGPYIYSITEDEMFMDECNIVIADLQEQQKSNIYDECKAMINSMSIESIVRDWIYVPYYCSESDPISFSNLDCKLRFLLIENPLDILERLSRLAFQILDWLGPSTFSGDGFGGCSGLRFLLSMQIDDIEGELKSILKYLVADVLEYTRTLKVCDVLDPDIQLFINRVIFPDGSKFLCAYLAGNPSRTDYLNTAIDIVDAIQSIPLEENRCLNAIYIISEYDPTAISSQIAGFNLTVRSGRQGFCKEIASAFSASAQYTPMPYFVPFGEDITQWTPFERLGEILPNFSFIEFVDIIAAAADASTLSKGISIFCDVFQYFVVDAIETDFAERICNALQKDNYDVVELICREATIYVQYPYYSYYYYSYNDYSTPPPSLRIPSIYYMIVTQVNMARDLFQLESISPESVCRAADDFFHSDHNLQSVVRFELDAGLKEMIPIGYDFCNDYENIINYFRGKIYLDINKFNKIVDDVSEFVLTFLGFSNRDALCNDLTVDGVTGRAEQESVSKFEDEFLRFLSDKGRCVAVMDGVQPFLNDLEQGAYIVYSVTGYGSSSELCETVTSFFSDRCNGVSTSIPESTPLTGSHGVVLSSLTTMVLLPFITLFSI